jgi:hypothetical protein
LVQTHKCTEWTREALIPWCRPTQHACGSQGGSPPLCSESSPDVAVSSLFFFLPGKEPICFCCCSCLLLLGMRIGSGLGGGGRVGIISLCSHCWPGTCCYDSCRIFDHTVNWENVLFPEKPCFYLWCGSALKHMFNPFNWNTDTPLVYTFNPKR